MNRSRLLSSLLPTALPALAVLLALVPASDGMAQVARRPLAPPGNGVRPAETAPTGMRPLHVTDRFMALPESRTAWEEYQARKAAGLIPVAGKTSLEIGTTQEFRVYSFALEARETIEFTLVLTEERFNVWVETAEYQNRVPDAVAEDIRAALADRTPAGSYDPNSGIIVNNELIFGAPPDADGDGRTDVLVLDIRDNCETTGQCVLGFFYPPDLGGQIGRDIIYLDVDPGITSFGEDEVLQTAAHEYQHLIHYGVDPAENTFVNEGLSEWAEVLNGYQARSISYLSDLTRQRGRLVYWPADLGGNLDYQRAGLFTNYIAERVGAVTTGDITKNRFYQGEAGYEDVLSKAGFSLKQIVRDFHVANFVNDRDAGDAYGYVTPQYTTVSAAARTLYDGSSATSMPAQTLGPIRPGGVDYHVFENVADLSVSLFVADGQGNPDVVKDRLAPMIAVTWDDGSMEVREAPIRDQPHVFSGQIRRAVVVVPHAQLTPAVSGGTTIGLSYDMSANWSPAEPSFREEEVTYDTGSLAGLDVVGLPAGNRAANHFFVPGGATLASVSVAPMFDHDFQGSEVPASAPRDYRLSVWDENVDPRIPASVPIFSIDRIDARSNSLTTDGTDNFFVFDTIDLGAHHAELSNLPSNVFISIEDLGDDENYMAYPLSSWDPDPDESPSLFYSEALFTAPSWRRLADLTLNGESLGNRVVPIRATFVVPVANESEAGLPDAWSLEPNWPNPFNPTTSIAYSVPAAQQVRLTVFDLLGRQVATLVDGLEPAGRHEVRFDAGGLASGVYLYALETGTRRLTRSMVLMK